jgi:hypothetical protein
MKGAMSNFKTESDLAKKLIPMLSEWGWEIYQEVVGYGGRCDIVAKREKLLWAIECKLTLSLALIEQANNWRWQAHYVSIACPRFPGNFVRQLLSHYGIGAFYFQGEDPEEAQRPHLNRKITPLKLYEEQKYYCEAGSASGGHFTKFKRTKNAMIQHVKKYPGIHFDQLLKEIDHHYSTLGTAKSCLRGFIGSSVIPELRSEIVDRKLCVFLADKKAVD